MEQETWDAIIVGAGPGGATAGLELAAAGFKVKIIEKQVVTPAGRYKACGGALAWELVEKTHLPPELIDREISCLELHHSRGTNFYKEGRGAVVWRSLFDKYLLDLALQAGCAIGEENPCMHVGLVPAEDGGAECLYSVETPNGKYTSKYLIAADGVKSFVLTQLGWPPLTRDNLVVTITREVQVGEAQIAQVLGDDRVHLFFGMEDLISLGYAWLFPKRDTISVGWGNALDHIPGTPIRDQYQKFLDLPLVQDAIRGGIIVRDVPHMIPVGFRAVIAQDRVLGVGDAIGAVDPISGKGIPYAILSGQLAAKSIKYAEDKGKVDQLARHYTKAVETKFGSVLRQKGRLRAKAFSSDDKLEKYLDLWQTHHSSEILAKNLLDAA